MERLLSSARITSFLWCRLNFIFHGILAHCHGHGVFILATNPEEDRVHRPGKAVLSSSSSHGDPEEQSSVDAVEDNCVRGTQPGI
jgi:hypothetical protein